MLTQVCVRLRQEPDVYARLWQSVADSYKGVSDNRALTGPTLSLSVFACHFYLVIDQSIIGHVSYFRSPGTILALAVVVMTKYPTKRRITCLTLVIPKRFGSM
jgi:hypothetical protein